MDGLAKDKGMEFYQKLLYPRLVEEKMRHLLRQGKISKWFSGIGQEAIAVGATLAMDPAEWILPMHRNLGVFTARGMPLEDLLRQWMGDPAGFSKGRERSFHFGAPDYHIWGMISHLGPQLSVADGIALAYQLGHQAKAVLVFTGEGGTSEGEFHEALNLASVWQLPVLFLIENNGYGLSTPVAEQYACARLSDRAKGYGMEGYTIDGNDLVTVYQTIASCRARAIAHRRPMLIECMTFRMRGHEEASGTRYVPAGLLDAWAEKDPVRQFADRLIREGIASSAVLEDVAKAQKQAIDLAVSRVEQPADWMPEVQTERGDVYAPSPAVVTSGEVSGPVSQDMRFINAITEGLEVALQRYPRLVLMGQDIAGYGGAFKVTDGLMDRYGKARVRNTPICESAVIGAALGLCAEGYKSVVEMQFADFAACGFNQIVNNLAKLHYRWGQAADVVIRMPTGGSVGAGPFHSQSNEAWFVHTPGLKVVYPATPADAKGLLLAAIADPNPVLYFEHKALYRSLHGPVPAGHTLCPIGKARVVQQGSEAAIITYGLGVQWALQYAQKHPEHALMIVDLRTLLPLDYAVIQEAVKATGKVLVLHEDTLIGGIGGEVAAWISEHCFAWLDAPVMRCASLDTPVPFAAPLEQQFLAGSRLEQRMEQLLQY